MVGMTEIDEMGVVGIVIDALMDITDIVGWIGSLSVALVSVVDVVVNDELHNGSTFSEARRYRQSFVWWLVLLRRV